MANEYPWESVWVGSRYANETNRTRKADRKFQTFEKLGSFRSPLGHVLEIGCGNCAFAKIVAQAGYAFDSYLGIDKSPSALLSAKENIAAISNSRTLLGDALNLPVADGSIDTIIALGVLEHIEDISACVREIRRVAAPGARILISTSNKKSLMYPARLIRQLLGAWRYGFQRNHTPSLLAAELSPSFMIARTSFLHGDRDFIFSTLFDKAISILNPDWSRYLLVEAISS